MARGIPKETQAFIRTHIRSIRQLEALLWLRNNSGRAVTPSTLAKEERLDADMAEDLFRGFERNGFVTGPDADGAYRYEPDPRQGAEVEKLAEVYGTYRVSVINFVFSMPSESVQSFADAFRIRQDDDDS